MALPFMYTLRDYLTGAEWLSAIEPVHEFTDSLSEGQAAKYCADVICISEGS